MAKLLIQGGRPLRGEVLVRGMKNAATKLVAASLLTKQECVLRNVPRVSDVLRMVQLVESLGVRTSWDDEHTLRLEARDLSSADLDRAAVKSMRSSVALLGPLLARFGKITLPEPGGDNIGRRPLDAIFFGLEALGASVERTNDSFILDVPVINSATVILPEFSVSATENTLMLAARAPGTTIIKMAAVEPSVQCLMDFLRKMGAEVKEIGTHTLAITGRAELGGAEHTIAPDNLEVGTFAVAAAATRGEVEVAPVVPAHLESVVEKLKAIGVPVDLREQRTPQQNKFASGQTGRREQRLAVLRVGRFSKLRAFKIQALPFPGFPTDLQAPFGVLATQCEGTSLIHDPLFEGRMGHINELIKMGANATICDPHRVLITGPTALVGREMPSLDIRAGATLVLAGLVASGETVINDAEILDRGYEDLAQRLAALGADIVRI